MGVKGVDMSQRASFLNPLTMVGKKEVEDISDLQ